MKTLALIPARGGSKRIPGKNTRLLGGRPLVEWTARTARDSGAFAEIVVSSDSDEVLKITAELGLRPDRRPQELAGDRVRFVEVLEEYLRRDENFRHYEAVAVLLPTCPFGRAEDIQAARELFEKNPASSVIAITPFDFPPDFAADFDPSTQTLVLRRPEVYAHSTQSQSVKPAFHPCGSFYWISTKRFLETQSFFTGHLIGYLMPAERAFDLDHPHQWPIAEALARQFLNP
jgi:pseudaminic acid cytidylyltransferase